MKTRRTSSGLALFLLGLAIACGRKGGEAGHGKAAEPAAPEARAAAGSPNLVKIDPGMLRDLRITVSKAEARPGGEGVKLLGEVAVNESAYSEVGVSAPARVSAVLAGPGDSVRRGQSLAKLESAELGNARAAYLKAKARAEVARAAVSRKRELSGRIVPVREVQEAEADARAADAELAGAAAGLRALGVPESEFEAKGGSEATMTLKSPVAGVVLERSAVPGRIADPARPLFRVGDLSRLWLVVQAFERDAVRIRQGTAARAGFPALPGRVLPGRVALVGRQVDVASRTIPVRIEVENSEGLLKPGMSAFAWVPFGEAEGEVVSVPAASLQRMQDAWCVFLPAGEGAFEVRPIGRGRDLGGEVEILSGLRAGETVVVDGAFLLKAEGDKARGKGEQHEH